MRYGILSLLLLCTIANAMIPIDGKTDIAHFGLRGPVKSVIGLLQSDDTDYYFNEQYLRVDFDARGYETQRMDFDRYNGIKLTQTTRDVKRRIRERQVDSGYAFDTFREVHEYDKHGVLLRESDLRGKKVSCRSDFAFDGTHCLPSRITTRTTENPLFSNIDKYTFNQAGRVKEQTIGMSIKDPSFFFERKSYRYDEKGRMVEVLTETPCSSIRDSWKLIYTYDNDGNLASKTTLAANAYIDHTYQYDQYKLDKYGNWISRRVTRQVQEENTGQFVDDGMQIRHISYYDDAHAAIATKVPELTTTGIWGNVVISKDRSALAFAIGLDNTGLFFSNSSKEFLRYAADGTCLNRWNADGDGLAFRGYPITLAIDKTGTIFAMSSGRPPLMKCYSSEGHFLRAWNPESFEEISSDLDPKTTFSVDVAGLVFYLRSASQHVRILTAEGKPLAGWAFSNPRYAEQPILSAISVDTVGHVYILDATDTKVMKFSPEGKLLTCWGKPGTGPGEFIHPNSLVVDSNGLVYVSDDFQANVQIFTDDGMLVGIWKHPAGIPVFYNDCEFRLALAPDGTVFLSDYALKQILHFAVPRP